MQQRQEQGHANQCREDAHRQLPRCQQCTRQGICNDEQAAPQQCRRRQQDAVVAYAAQAQHVWNDQADKAERAEQAERSDDSAS